jgi:hypothetical protein
MPFFLGIVVLVLLLWAVQAFSKADPKQAARLLRPIGAGVALIFAVFLLLGGEIGPAITVGVLGLGWLGWLTLWPASIVGRTQKSPGQVSHVRTVYLEMELDHDSGAMRGRILAGRHQGASLDALDLATLLELFGEIDGDSRDLLAAYLDRQQPGWREHAQDDAAGGRRTQAAAPGQMTEEESFQILHPDQGGSTYLAARVNEAKEVLLRRRG